MRQELKNRLYEKYPMLYREIYKSTMVNDGFGSGDGWYTLLNTLSAFIVERDPEAVFSDITKDYCGRLQAYMYIYNVDEDHDYICAVIGMASRLSNIICEKCGKYELACKEHYPDRQNENVEWPNKIELPLKFKNLGKMWHEMSRIVYESVSKCTKAYKLPCVNFERIEIKTGKLVIKISGGTKPFEAGLNFLLTYANMVDPDTGEILTLEHWNPRGVTIQTPR